jgi:hypothetical protein
MGDSQSTTSSVSAGAIRQTQEYNSWQNDSLDSSVMISLPAEVPSLLLEVLGDDTPGVRNLTCRGGLNIFPRSTDDHDN